MFRVYHDRLVEETDRAAYISTIRDICKSRLKVEFNALCKNVAQPNSKSVEDKDLGKLLFCDFGETKNEDKFYKEVSNIDSFRYCSKILHKNDILPLNLNQNKLSRRITILIVIIHLDRWQKISL